MNTHMIREGFVGGFGGFMGLVPVFALGFLLFTIWSIFWKGLALWHAGQRKQGWWFIALLLLNTGGLLDIAYLFVVLKLKVKDLFAK